MARNSLKLWRVCRQRETGGTMQKLDTQLERRLREAWDLHVADVPGAFIMLELDRQFSAKVYNISSPISTEFQNIAQTVRWLT